jgi:uncharacterized protein YndB with AHSA1/START domain
VKNIGTVNITTPTDREIVITRFFDAPRAIVFESWTKAEHIAHWWDPSGLPLAVCEIDLRPGGAFRWVHRAPDGGEGHSFTGVYREIVPPEKLVFTVRMFPSSPEPVGTLVFTEDRKKTKLTMEIECTTKKDRDALLEMRIDAGTALTLENLAAYLPKFTLAGSMLNEGADFVEGELETKQEDLCRRWQL